MLQEFDLVFSSFVLFELSTKAEIIDYLNLAASKLRKDGVFFGITGSEFLHQKRQNWMCFRTDYPENMQPTSGDIVKLGLKEPEIEFSDYYWTESDYKECFKHSHLELIKVYYPLAHKEEPFNWMDELTVPPFVIFIAKK